MNNRKPNPHPKLHATTNENVGQAAINVVQHDRDYEQQPSQSQQATGAKGGQQQAAAITTTRMISYWLTYIQFCSSIHQKSYTYFPFLHQTPPASTYSTVSLTAQGLLHNLSGLPVNAR